MIEAAVTFRARPRCDRCGWVGAWRTSHWSARQAEERAAAQLREHSEFWHPERGA